MIFDIGHPCCGQLTPVKPRYPLTRYPQAQVKISSTLKAESTATSVWLATGWARAFAKDRDLVTYPITGSRTFEVLIIEQQKHSEVTGGLLTVAVKKWVFFFHHTYVPFSDIPRLESRIARCPVLARRPFPVLKHPPRFWRKSTHNVCARREYSHFWDNHVMQRNSEQYKVSWDSRNKQNTQSSAQTNCRRGFNLFRSVLVVRSYLLPWFWCCPMAVSWASPTF